MAVDDSVPEAQRDKRLRQRERLHREARYAHLLHAAIVGFLAGVLGTAYQFAVNKSEILSGIVAGWARSTGLIACVLLVAFTAAIGGATAFLIGRFAPESGGSGIPHIKAVLIHLRILRPLRVIVAKFVGGLSALTIGMSLGREGPTIQMGAAVGQFVGHVLKIPRRNRTSLLAAGAGAGLAAAFNAPLAGFLFVMEELRREMSALTYGSALIASVCAVGVTRYLSGMKPQFNLPSPGPAPLQVIPLTAVLGIICGLGGLLFNWSLLGAIDIRTKLKVPRFAYGVAVGLLSGLALLYFRQITQSGHGVTEALLLGQFSSGHIVIMLLAIFFAKLFLTSTSYGTGVPGGIFAPILVLGSVLGYLVGVGFHAIGPGIPFSNGGFATLGMAALLAGSVRAPLTGCVLIVEMTGEYGLLYSLLVVTFTASLTAEICKGMPIYDTLMERDLHAEGAEIEPRLEPLLLDVLIEPHSRMDGLKVRNLRLPEGAILTTVDRDSKKIVPGGNTMLHAGDMVTILVEGDKPELCLEIHERAKGPG